MKFFFGPLEACLICFLSEHIQISQVPSRNEPDSDGEINYPYIFHQIAKLGYKGWIGCEYHPRGKLLVS